MADVAPPSAPSFKKRTTNKNIRKRPATPPPNDVSDSDSASDYTDDEQGARVKRRKKDGVSVIAAKKAGQAQDFSKSTKYAADRSTTIAANDDATKASTWYTDASLAADSAVATAKAKRQERGDDDEEGAGNRAYKGSAQYSSFIQKNPEARAVGPVKAPTNVRMITVTDFAPDVCKDYKQTGFCGFGDSCKFLHAREDYKQGWQLDKEWEKAGKKDKPSSSSTKTNNTQDDGLTEEERMLEGIPFKCIICKEDYKTPVVTKCGHYFCEKCAMQRYMKEKKRTCANCGVDTGGSFGVARKLRELLEAGGGEGEGGRIVERELFLRDPGETGRYDSTE